MTPRLGIAFCDPIEYFFEPEKGTCSTDNVLFNNTLQLRSNTRHIFSKNADFSIAKKWLKENPKSASLNKKRVSVNEARINPNYNPDSYFYDPVFRYWDLNYPSKE